MTGGPGNNKTTEVDGPFALMRSKHVRAGFLSTMARALPAKPPGRRLFAVGEYWVL